MAGFVRLRMAEERHVQLSFDWKELRSPWAMG